MKVNNNFNFEGFDADPAFKRFLSSPPSTNISNSDISDLVKHSDDLSDTIRDAIDVSKMFSRVMDGKDTKSVYAADLFSGLCSRALTFINCIPTHKSLESNLAHWDSSSIMSLARSIVEMRILFFYLCVESCDSKAWKCRQQVIFLHSLCGHIKSIIQGMKDDELEISDTKILGPSKNWSVVHAIEAQASILRNEIKKNPFFEKAHYKSQILDGTYITMYTLSSIAPKAGIKRSAYNSFHDKWCKYVHSNPVSITEGKLVGSGVLTVDEFWDTHSAVLMVSNCIIQSYNEMSEIIQNRFEALESFGIIKNESGKFVKVK